MYKLYNICSVAAHNDNMVNIKKNQSISFYSMILIIGIMYVCMYTTKN